MKSKILKIMVIALAIAGLSGSGYLFYVKIQLDDQVAELQEDVASGERKLAMLKKKYAQEKAKVTACSRAKMAQEARNAKLQKDTAKAAHLQQAAEAKLATVQQAFDQKKKHLEARIAKLLEIRDKLVETRNELAEKYRAKAEENSKQKQEISRLKSEFRQLEAEYNFTVKSLDRSRKHNRRLCEIAEEVANKYQARYGSEPFTKLGKVEMEKMIQQYIKQIDKQRIVEQ